MTTPTDEQKEAAVQAMREKCIAIARPLAELNDLAEAALTAAAGVGGRRFGKTTCAECQAVVTYEIPAAGVGDDELNRALIIDMSMKDEIAATIERCAQW